MHTGVEGHPWKAAGMQVTERASHPRLCACVCCCFLRHSFKDPRLLAWGLHLEDSLPPAPRVRPAGTGVACSEGNADFLLHVTLQLFSFTTDRSFFNK